jgi:hypothetical protein
MEGDRRRNPLSTPALLRQAGWVSRPPYPQQRPHPANRDPDSLPGRQGLFLCDIDFSLAQGGLVLLRRTLSDMHDPELRALAGCRRPGLLPIGRSGGSQRAENHVKC